MDELRSYVTEYNIDIIGVTDTWLNEHVGNSKIALHDFTIYHKDRGKGKQVELGSSTPCQQLFNVTRL